MPRTRPVRGILFFGGCDVLTPACAQWADWSGYRGEQGGNACTALLPLVLACCATPSDRRFSDCRYAGTVTGSPRVTAPSVSTRA